MEIKDLIARIVLVKDLYSLKKMLEEAKGNSSLSPGIRKKFQDIIYTKDTDKFRALKARVINLLQVEEQSTKFLIPSYISSNDDDDNDTLLPVSNKDADSHKVALSEINDTLHSIANNLLTEIETYKGGRKDRESNLIALVHCLNELLANPEHKEYINLNEKLLLSIVEVQQKLISIRRGKLYRPLDYLLDLYPHPTICFGPNQFCDTYFIVKDFLKALVWSNKEYSEQLRIFLSINKACLYSKLGLMLIDTILTVAKEDQNLQRALTNQKERGLNPLHYAAEIGKTDAAIALLEATTDNSELAKLLESKDNVGLTLLHKAVRNNDDKLVSSILESSKKLGCVNRVLYAKRWGYCETPFEYAFITPKIRVLMSSYQLEACSSMLIVTTPVTNGMLYYVKPEVHKQIQRKPPEKRRNNTYSSNPSRYTTKR